MVVEQDVHKALEGLEEQEAMMAKEIEQHGWEKVQKHLHSTATAFDKTGKLLSDQALAENQLKQAQKVLSRMRSARKAAKKEAKAKEAENLKSDKLRKMMMDDDDDE